jgi:hypothetical protein
VTQTATVSKPYAIDGSIKAANPWHFGKTGTCPFSHRVTPLILRVHGLANLTRLDDLTIQVGILARSMTPGDIDGHAIVLKPSPNGFVAKQDICSQ